MKLSNKVLMCGLGFVIFSILMCISFGSYIEVRVVFGLFPAYLIATLAIWAGFKYEEQKEIKNEKNH
jgi:hypothetical protein